MYGTLIGIKVVNLKTLVVSRLLGKVENGERFTKLTLFQGAMRNGPLKGRERLFGTKRWNTDE